MDGIVVRQKGGVQSSVDVSPRRLRTRLAHVPRTEAGTVTVSAFGALGDRGRRGAAAFKATQKPTDERKPYSELGSGGPARRG